MLDGLRATVEVAGRPLEMVYRVGTRGHGPTALMLNGVPLEFKREPNHWRTGGAVVQMAELYERLGNGSNTLVVDLG